MITPVNNPSQSQQQTNNTTTPPVENIDQKKKNGEFKKRDKLPPLKQQQPSTPQQTQGTEKNAQPQPVPTANNNQNQQPAQSQPVTNQPQGKPPMREPDEEEKKYEENRPNPKTKPGKPDFELTRTVRKYNTSPDDIKVGDVWAVNFPSSKDKHKKSNGDSLECIFHPALVMSKTGGDRGITVVEISHQKSDFKVQSNNLEINCNMIANLGPHHFKKKRDYIDPNSDKFKEVQATIQKAKAANKLITLTQEATDLFFAEIHNIDSDIQHVGLDLGDREIKHYRNKTNYMMLYTKYDNEHDLDQDWEAFNRMTIEMQRQSNWKRIEIVGKTNPVAYEEMKHKYLTEPVTTPIISPEYIPLMESAAFMEPTNIVQKILHETAQDELEYEIERFNEVTYGGTPYFTTNEMKAIGVSYIGDNPRFSSNPVVTSFKDQPNKVWFQHYQNMLNGWSTNTLPNYYEWKKFMQSMFDKMNLADTMEVRNSYKQAILDFGWNPSVDPTQENFKFATKRVSSIMEESVSNIYLMDLTESVNHWNRVINENVDESMVPMFIVFYNSTTLFNKVARFVQKSPYSHVGIGFDYNLSKIWSFEGNNNSLMKEDVKSIDDAKEIQVFITFITPEKRAALEHRIMMLKASNATYSLLNLITIPLQINYVANMKMVCSQFADTMLKLADLDLTKVGSNLVSPVMLNKAVRKKKYQTRVLKVYQGPPKKYSGDKVRNFVLTMNDKSLYTQEQQSLIDRTIFAIQEAKDLPIQFDDDGNLLIDKGENLDFEAEYSKCHLAMKNYEKAGNIEGMKYCLCKLWYLNGVLEEKIHKEKDAKKKQEYYKVRARILGDITRYMKIVQKKDPDFDMLKEYENSPFSDDKVRIRRSTLYYTIDLIKKVIGVS